MKLIRLGGTQLAIYHCQDGDAFIMQDCNTIRLTRAEIDALVGYLHPSPKLQKCRKGKLIAHAVD
jgi:hypothetical protein